MTDILGNLTIVLPSYKCDKNCPFCIAKNNRKFNDEGENFKALEDQLKILRENNIVFDKVVLSGNGEPSLYDLETLKKYAKILKDHENYFNTLRIHTSGNIFFEPDKFNLFNNLTDNIEFDIMRAAIDSTQDMKTLGYQRDYTKTPEFKNAKRIKIDIALTKKLEDENVFPKMLDQFILDNPNIKLIRFKYLMTGDNSDSKQAKWIISERMKKENFVSFGHKLLDYYNCSNLNDLMSSNGTKILFERCGNYAKDIIFNGGQLKDYNENPISISNLQYMANTVDESKDLTYNDIER